MEGRKKVVIIGGPWRKRPRRGTAPTAIIHATKPFKNKEIEITIHEIDETDYLTRSEANKQKLLAAIANVEQKTKLVQVTLANLAPIRKPPSRTHRDASSTCIGMQAYGFLDRLLEE